MATVERFEDLKIWQAARDVVNAMYQASSDGAFSRDYALPHGIYDSGVIPQGRHGQIRRAAVSIPSNSSSPREIHEMDYFTGQGFSRHSNKREYGVRSCKPTLECRVLYLFLLAKPAADRGVVYTEVDGDFFHRVPVLPICC